MKVLLTSHLFPNKFSTISGIFVKEEVSFLKEWCDLKVLAPVPWFPPLGGFGRWSRLRQIPKREAVDGIEVSRPRYLTFPRMILFWIVGLFYFISLFKETRRLKFDLIHAHVAYPDGFGAVLLGIVFKRPVVVTVHGSDLKLFPRKWLLKGLIGWTLRRANFVIAVSEDMKRLAEAMGVKKDKVGVIYNGVNTKLFRICGKGERKVENYKVKRIIYVGRFDRRKGLGVLLAASARIFKMREDVELVLLGRNKERKDDEEFRVIAKNLGIDDKVKFVDAVPIDQVPLWLYGSDLMVLPSFSESFGLCVIEALACGKPVVSTRCGGPEEVVTEDVGILVEPRDVEGLKDAMLYVLDHPQEYKAEKIAQYAKNRFDLEVTAQRVLEVYSCVLDARKSFHPAR